MNKKLITDVKVEGIDLNDYPKFCDAFLSGAKYKGKQLTDTELEELNNDAGFVLEKVNEYLY